MSFRNSVLASIETNTQSSFMELAFEVLRWLLEVCSAMNLVRTLISNSGVEME